MKRDTNKKNLKLLEYIADLFQLEIDRVKIQSKLSDVTLPSDDFSALPFIGSYIGVKVQSFHGNWKYPFPYVSSSNPWVAKTTSGEILILLEENRRKVKIHNLDENENVWITKDELKAKLGKEEIEWILPEPLHPFTVSRKDEGSIHPVRRVWSFLRLEAREIKVIIIYGIAIGLLSLVVPVATSSLVNIVAFGVLFQPVLVLTFLVVVFLGFAGVMQAIQTFVVEILQRRIFVRVINEFTVKIPEVNESEFMKEDPESLMNRFFDTMTLQKAIASLLTDGLAVILTTIIGLIIVAIYHPIFIVFDLLILFVGYYLIIYSMASPAIDTSVKESKIKYATQRWIEQVSVNRNLFRSEAGKEYLLEKTEAYTSQYLEARQKHFKYLLRQIIGLLGLQAIASAIVLAIGGWLVINRQLTIGQLVAAELIIAKVLDGMAKFGKHLETFYDFIAGLDKIAHVTELELMQEGLTEEISIGKKSSLVVQNLTYSDEFNNSFDGIHFQANENEKISLFSQNSRSLSYFLQGMIGSRKMDSGTIEISGRNIREFHNDSLRSLMYLCAGDSIFSGSILENMKIVNPDVTDSECSKILEKFGIFHKLNSFPDGLNSILQGNDETLTSLDKKFLNLSRIFLTKSPIIFIDHELDFLPSDFQKLVLDEILSPKFKKTIILATSDRVIHSKFPKKQDWDNMHLPKPKRGSR